MSDRTDAARHAGAAPPASIAALWAALSGRLEVVAAAYPLLETKSGGARAANVVPGWLPPKESAGAEDFPFLIVRPRSGVDTEQAADQNATAVVDIVVGTYSDTDDGWLDVMILIDAIRADLGAEPAISGTAFEQVGPLTWEIPVEQYRPQWFGTVKTIWNVPRPQRVEERNPQREE